VGVDKGVLLWWSRWPRRLVGGGGQDDIDEGRKEIPWKAEEVVQQRCRNIWLHGDYRVTNNFNAPATAGRPFQLLSELHSCISLDRQSIRWARGTPATHRRWLAEEKVYKGGKGVEGSWGGKRKVGRKEGRKDINMSLMIRKEGEKGIYYRKEEIEEGKKEGKNEGGNVIMHIIGRD
jgi:hypothetical protein